MELKEIKWIIDLMTKNGLTEFELEKDNVKIRLRRGPDGISQTSPSLPLGNGGNGTSTLSSSQSLSVASAPLIEHKEIRSPMVGTFYRFPSPEAAPYVEIGQTVTEETVVCIIEAMKVMNEIKAEVRGIITEALVENAKPVEFGKPLFRVKAV